MGYGILVNLERADQTAVHSGKSGVNPSKNEAQAAVSLIHQWSKLRRELAQLAVHSDKRQEILRLFDGGQEYLQRHGNHMFFLGATVGIALFSTLILTWRIYTQG